jgi:glycosyltransferase involved in cell wall biosynthesis
MRETPIRVAVVCSTLNMLGGPAVNISNIYRHLHGDGFAVTLVLCTADEPMLRRFMLGAGVKPEDMLFIPHARKVLLLPFVRALRDLLRAGRFDVVHAFDTQTQVLVGWAARAGRMPPVLCHCVAQFLPSTVSLPKRILYRALNRWVGDAFERSLAVSDGLARELVGCGFRPAERVEVLPVGVELGSDNGEPERGLAGLAAGAPVIGALSRLCAEKGLERFIRAAPSIVREVPAARFVICGQGDQEPALRRLVAAVGLVDRFDFRPWTDRVRETLRELDIYVFPSLREGLPLTLLEAMSVGRACVASDIEGVRDAIESGVDGLLVDTADTAALADAIVSLCREPERAARLAGAGRRKVRARFGVDREIARLREIYREVTGRASAG